jgi:hypothetical protein
LIIDPSGDLGIEAVITNVFVDEKGKPRQINDKILNIWPDLCESIYLENEIYYDDLNILFP